MIKPDDPRELVLALLARSPCHVQVAAVLADRDGCFAWGWNSAGDGFGEHAEAACIRRANKRRLHAATLYVAARRRKSMNIVTARPCAGCAWTVRGVGEVVYRDGEGVWHKYS